MVKYFEESLWSEVLGTQTREEEFFVSRVGAKKTKSFCPDSRSKNTKTFFFFKSIAFVRYIQKRTACSLSAMA